MVPAIPVINAISALAIVRHECDVKIESQRSQDALTGKAELRNKEAANVRKKAES